MSTIIIKMLDTYYGKMTLKRSTPFLIMQNNYVNHGIGPNYDRNLLIEYFRRNRLIFTLFCCCAIALSVIIITITKHHLVK